MDSPFFKSKYLNRTVYFEEVDQLSARDAASLRAELRVAVSTMQEKMHQERDVAESDWLYGISLKIKICEQFLELLDDLKNMDSSKLNHYHLLYFRQEVSNALGPLRAQKLFDRARSGAVTQLRKEFQS